MLGEEWQVDADVENGAAHGRRGQLCRYPGVAHRVAVADRRDPASQLQRLERHSCGAQRDLGRPDDGVAHGGSPQRSLLIVVAWQATGGDEDLVSLRVLFREGDELVTQGTGRLADL